ncbi:MAG: hypothetical protein GY723_23550 [bacterium]|nr:hypothetical protein [bacterium]MCP5065023.1 hypothetical protein [bacterium]
MHQHSDGEKLAVVLRHWMDHNRSHVEDFEKWAEKARSSGHEKVSQRILQAAEQMAKANTVLEGALSELNDEGGA